jgi:dephospho-CoA kinase
MSKQKGVVVFITGVSGVGKSTLVPVLKEVFPTFAVHDFDEVGVPLDVDVAWRLSTTDHWLREAKTNLAKGISTIICGLSSPNEVLNSDEFNKFLNLRFGIIKISEDQLRKRLKKRGYNSELIQDNLNWVKVLEKETQEIKNHIILNGERKLIEIADEIKNWLK